MSDENPSKENEKEKERKRKRESSNSKERRTGQFYAGDYESLSVIVSKATRTPSLLLL